MATLYLRGTRWSIAYWKNGEQFFESTGLLAHQKDEALKLKAKIEAGLRAEKKKREANPGPGLKTFRGYRKHWVETRKAQGVGTAHDDEVRLKHVPELDPLRMDEIKPQHVRNAILRLRSAGKLAPRTIRHVGSVLRMLFADAAADGVIQASPYVLRRGDLPKKKDADPLWRSKAVFSREEVELLLSHPDVPDERRTLYALLFLTGMRIGELAALQWTAYEPDLAPLGRLTVAHSFNRKAGKVKETKSEKPRLVPVHPLLAAVLADWKLHGWRAYMGFKPTPTDLLYPTKTGNHLRDPVVHANLLRDLAKLGKEPRRTHDTRRTFISLAQADGARPDRLKWITHGPPDSIMDLYTTLPWEILCREVSCLNIRVRGTVPTPLHRQSH